MGMLENTKRAARHTMEVELGRYLANCAPNNRSYVYIRDPLRQFRSLREKRELRAARARPPAYFNFAPDFDALHDPR